MEKKIDRETRTNLDKAGLLITYQENDEKKPNCDKTGKACINVTSIRVRVTTAAVEKQQVLHILCVCVCVCVCVALVIHHEMRMRSTIFSSVAYFSLKYFSTLFHKRHDFREGEGLMNTNYVF